MSLLANVNQPTTGQYYFALDTNHDDTVVTAPAFVATGVGQPSSVGTFTAQGDAVPGGIDVFSMSKASGQIQWSMGMANAPTGTGNVGNDLAIFSYDDSGNFLDAPLAITRATGDVSVGHLIANDISAGDMDLTGNLTVAGTITGTIAALGGWTQFFTETVAPVELEEASNTPIFTIPLPAALQNATKYTIRISDINIPLIQGSQLDRALVYFDWNPTRNGISYISGGAGQLSVCDNNWIWLDNFTGGTGSALQAGTSFTNPATGPLNAPIAPFSNNAFYAGAAAPGGTYNPSLASLNLPVFNLFNYNGDAVSQIYCVFNPDPNNGTQAVGSMPAGARLRCIVEAYFAPKY